MDRAGAWGDELERDPDGYLVGPSGCTYCNAVQAFYYDELKFCGCAQPETALGLVRDALAALAEEGYEARSEAISKIAPTDHPLGLVFLYMLDRLDLIEHGSSIYGAWISAKGRAVLQLLTSCDPFQALEATYPEQTVPLSEVGADQNVPPKGKG